MIHGARLGLAVAAALLAAGSPAAAATLQASDTPPELTRSLELHPYAGFREAYDSNIFLHRSAESSWIHTIDGGLLLAGELMSDRNRYELNYDVADRIYSKNPGVANGVIQGAGGRYWYRSPSGLTARATEAFLNTVDQASTELTLLRRRWQNTAGLEVAYQPEDGRVFLEADGQHVRHKYVADDPTLRLALDRYEQTFGAKVGWQVQPKTVAYLAYHRELIHFTDHPSPSRDNKGHLIDVGVEGQLTSRITGKAQGGIVERLYDEPASPGLDRRTRNFSALVDLAYVPGERSKLDLAFTRSLEESAFDINQFYIATAGRLTLDHTFPWGLFARVYGGIEFDKYPTTATIGALQVNRRDDNYQTGVDVEYPVGDHLKLAAGTLYRVRYSRDLSEQFDYHDQLTSVSATVAF